ncbi:MAG: hypothetical protein GX589_08030 [Deltaproteobacteria bacterium]|nr:hypothetical protein [Deltaproteobacteria bacterium]
MTRDLKDTAIYVAYEDFEPTDLAVAEKDLLRAVLLTAMRDIQRNGEHSKKAREYFLSPEDKHLFSFRSVCDLLDIDRSQVLRIVGLMDGRPFEGGLHRPTVECTCSLTVKK